MDIVFDWMRANIDVFGFLVGTVIFIVTLVLVTRKSIGFWITLLLLFFALFTGFSIANINFIKENLQCRVGASEVTANFTAENVEIREVN